VSGCAGVGRALEGARREGAWLSFGPIRPEARFRLERARRLRRGQRRRRSASDSRRRHQLAIQSAFLLVRRLEGGRAGPLAGGEQAAVARDYASA